MPGGRWHSPTSSGWGAGSFGRAPANTSPGAMMVEVAKPGPGSWAGVAPAAKGTQEGSRKERGANCPEQGFLGTNLGSPRQPYALGCSPAPQALPCTRGCPQHSSSSHGRIPLSPTSCPQSEHPRHLHTFHALTSQGWSSPRGVTASPSHWGLKQHNPVQRGWQRGHLSLHQPLPLTFPQVRRPRFVQAQFDFSSHDCSQLPFLRGDIIEVLDCADPNWWQGKIYGRIGLFPRSYVHPICK